MLQKLPIASSNKKYSVILLVIVFVSIFYLISTRVIGVNSSPNVENIEKNSNSSAFFVPPSSTTKELKVTGKVVLAEPGEKSGATHKIVDDNNNVLIYAVTNDDKLTQQEGNIVTLVGTVPFNENVDKNSLLQVMYIAFK